MNGKYEPGDIILNNWKLVRLIGEGSFGRVFEAQREGYGRVPNAAFKIITIPRNRDELKSIAAEEGQNTERVTQYFQGVVDEFVEEFTLMSKLKGHSNIVSYEDHEVLRHEGSIGWDIIIRMELLTPLYDHIQRTTLTKKDIMFIGIDMCKALELCQKFKIIHRDIKPENIFYSEIGRYKLGDFGIARTAEKNMVALSRRGTYK